MHILSGIHILNDHLTITSFEHVEITGHYLESNVSLKGNKLEIHNILQDVVIKNLVFISNFTEMSGYIVLDLINSLVVNGSIFWETVIHISSNSTTISECTFSKTLITTIKV